MLCPYPNCGNDIHLAGTGAHCSSCAQPILVCPMCQALNRTLARYCRNCGGPIRFSELSTDGFSRWALQPIAPVKVGELFGLSAELVAYGGYLWAMNFDGELYRIARAESKMKRCGGLPGSRYTFPFSIEEDEKRGPVIYANNASALFRYEILRDRFDEVQGLYRSGDVLISSVLKVKGNYYCLVRRGGDEGHVFLRCAGTTEWEFPLGGLSLLSAEVQPIRQIGESLWVFTQEKLLVFPNFSRSEMKEMAWSPWRIFPSDSGIWYSQRAQTGHFGEQQSIWRITFEGKDIERVALEEDLPVTARVAVNPHGGQIAIFASQNARVFEFNKHRYGRLEGIIEINNPEILVLSPSLLCWFEPERQTVYGWLVETSKIWALWTFDWKINFSRLFLTDGCLYGLTNEEVWRWDLVGS